MKKNNVKRNTLCFFCLPLKHIRILNDKAERKHRLAAHALSQRDDSPPQ